MALLDEGQGRLLRSGRVRARALRNFSVDTRSRADFGGRSLPMHRWQSEYQEGSKYTTFFVQCKGRRASYRYLLPDRPGA